MARNSSVIKIITSALINDTGDYNVTDSEWSNGCRSDLVLEPKSLSTGLFPIVIEFQQSVNNTFMKRVIKYALQAYQRYQIDPIIFIICMNSVSNDIESLTEPSHILGCRSYPCPQLGCLIGNQVHLVDFVKELLNTQEKQYQHLLTFASQQNSSQAAIQTSIQNAQAQKLELKRKFDELDDMALTSTFTTVPSTTSFEASPSPSPSPSYNVASSTLYQKCMTFVLQFKAARIKQGKERMDWKSCMMMSLKNRWKMCTATARNQKKKKSNKK
ncbi:hypothetical protein INT48_000429 [Thamnidium elegans]|uniref:Uncharacterized protein n=1 Tax=Thamnidium elegans TaxID=101142 RepID=A0A8H7SJN0_9FUNG|nr:hypothetical protein INT48_000429 [Thamnidium elegans]